MDQEQNNDVIIRNIIIIVIVVSILLSTISFRVSPGFKKFGYKVKIWFKTKVGRPFLY